MGVQEQQQGDYLQKIIKEDKTINITLERIDKIFDAVTEHHGDVQKAIPVLKESFTSLRNTLELYFDLQEHHGILEDLKKEHPRIQSFVKSIYEGDNKLLKYFDSLHDELSEFIRNSARADWKMFHQDYLGFVKQLHDHKDKINQLIMDTYNLDIGSCD